MKKMKIAAALVIVASLAFLGALLVLIGRAEVSWRLIRSEEFDGQSLNVTDWKVHDKTLFTRSQAYYMDGNVYMKNGALVILTRRHCVDQSVDLSIASNRSVLNDATATSNVCPSDKQTVYSSGYVTSNFRTTKGKIEIRAKQPVMQRGWWGGLWLRNQSPWCEPNYGELDINENYGHSPNTTTATSHMGCTPDGTKTYMQQHHKTYANPISDNWHVWAIEFDEGKIVYTMDGELIPAPYGSNGNGGADIYSDTPDDFIAKGWPLTLPKAEQKFADIINQTWETRLEVQVLKTTNPPDNTIPFQPMEYYIDYVRYYDKTTIDPVDTVPPSAPTNLTVAPVNIAQPSSIDPIKLSWNASTDNVGVVQYVVTRDSGYTAGTSTTTTFSDSTADKTGCVSTCHSYVVYAIDAAGNRSAASNTVFGQVASSINAADINKDGVVNVFDLSILLSKWGTTDIQCDINRDSTVNILDLSLLLSNWSR